MHKDTAIVLLTSYIDNWQEVLTFHGEKTLPHYVLCANGTDTQLPTDYQNAIDGWKNKFCPLVGSYDDKGTFHLNPS